jgi:hypothetical protein
MLVTILALTLCLSTAALFPIDIFLVSRIMDPVTGLRYEWATDEVIAGMQLSVKIIYHGKLSLPLKNCLLSMLIRQSRSTYSHSSSKTSPFHKMGSTESSLGLLCCLA